MTHSTSATTDTVVLKRPASKATIAQAEDGMTLGLGRPADRGIGTCR
ncbi:MAG: hypothetical protein ABIR16_00365 [Dokdonella sp.]